jgi:Gene product 88
MTSPKISQTSKLSARSWSLQARESCPGSIGENGQPVEACAACYATQGSYNFPAVIESRAFNRDDWKRSDFVASMVQALQNDRYFRLFDSGDFVSVELAQKWLEIFRACPWVSFWVPTRSHKFEKFRQVFDQMKKLQNVALRFSSDSITGEFTPGLHGSIILHPDAPTPEGVTRCNSPGRAENALIVGHAGIPLCIP